MNYKIKSIFISSITIHLFHINQLIYKKNVSLSKLNHLISILFKNFKFLNYFFFRENYFNKFLKTNVKKHLKIRPKFKKRTSIFSKDYNSVLYKEPYVFKFNYDSTTFTYFFLSFRHFLFSSYLSNSFSLYKNNILIFNINTDLFFIKNTLLSSEYDISNFLDLEI